MRGFTFPFLLFLFLVVLFFEDIPKKIRRCAGDNHLKVREKQKHFNSVYSLRGCVLICSLPMYSMGCEIWHLIENYYTWCIFFINIEYIHWWWWWWWLLLLLLFVSISGNFLVKILKRNQVRCSVEFLDWWKNKLGSEEEIFLISIKF